LNEADDDYERKQRKLKDNFKEDLEAEEKKLKKATVTCNEIETRIMGAVSSGQGTSDIAEVE
jgi:hypothetical protein